MSRWTQCAGYLVIPGCWRGACQCRAQCPEGPGTRRTASPAARARPAGTSQSSTFSIVKIFIWLIKNILGDTSIFHDICYFFHSPWPDIVLMIGFIVELTREPELFPHWRAPPLEVRVDGILVLAIHLQTRCWKRAISKSSKYSILTSVLANSSKLGTNPLPGLTCFSEAYISLAFLPGSCAHIALDTPLIFLVAPTCLRNWLQCIN